MPHAHQLVDGDSRFLIDVVTRAISNKLLKKKILILKVLSKKTKDKLLLEILDLSTVLLNMSHMLIVMIILNLI